MTMIEAYTTLTGIGGAISEQRYLESMDATAQGRYQTDLLRWFDHAGLSLATWALSEQQTTQLAFNLLALWHATWLSLFVDLNILEQSIGRDGSDVPLATVEYVESWVADQSLSRCLLHALLLHDCIDRLPIGSVLLPSVPRALFSAVNIWQAFLTYRPDDAAAAVDNTFSHPTRSDSTEFLKSLPEIQKISSITTADDDDNQAATTWSATARATLTSKRVYGSIARLHEILGGSVLTGIKQRTLYTLADTLRRSSTYGVAQRMANVAETMLSYHGEQQRDSDA